jgi:hypothetical protein
MLQQQQQQQRSSKWGPPVYPVPAAGLPSAHRQLHRRAASWGPEAADAVVTTGVTHGLLHPQQQRHSSLGQQGPLLLSQIAGAGAAATPVAAASGHDTYVITQEDVLLQLMEDADEAAAAAADASHAGLPVSVDVGQVSSRRHGRQQQQQQRSLNHPQQQQQGPDAADSSAPLITMLEVLVVRPLLAQHRLTTLACWQLLLQVSACRTFIKGCNKHTLQTQYKRCCTYIQDGAPATMARC